MDKDLHTKRSLKVCFPPHMGMERTPFHEAQRKINVLRLQQR